MADIGRFLLAVSKGSCRYMELLEGPCLCKRNPPCLILCYGLMCPLVPHQAFCKLLSETLQGSYLCLCANCTKQVCLSDFKHSESVAAHFCPQEGVWALFKLHRFIGETEPLSIRQSLDSIRLQADPAGPMPLRDLYPALYQVQLCWGQPPGSWAQVCSSVQGLSWYLTHETGNTGSSYSILPVRETGSGEELASILLYSQLPQDKGELSAYSF